VHSISDDVSAGIVAELGSFWMLDDNAVLTAWGDAVDLGRDHRYDEFEDYADRYLSVGMNNEL
jgi:hypothetical protein